MRIMPRRRAKPAIVMQTAKHKLQHALARKSMGAAKEVQRRKPPVDAAEAQVLGQMVFEFVAALLWALVSVSLHTPHHLVDRKGSPAYCVEALDVGDVLLDDELEVVGQLALCGAAAPGPRSERHFVWAIVDVWEIGGGLYVVGSKFGVEWHGKCETCRPPRFIGCSTGPR